MNVEVCLSRTRPDEHIEGVGEVRSVRCQLEQERRNPWQVITDSSLLEGDRVSFPEFTSSGVVERLMLLMETG